MTMASTQSGTMVFRPAPEPASSSSSGSRHPSNTFVPSRLSQPGQLCNQSGQRKGLVAQTTRVTAVKFRSLRCSKRSTPF